MCVKLNFYELSHEMMGLPIVTSVTVVEPEIPGQGLTPDMNISILTSAQLNLTLFSLNLVKPLITLIYGLNVIA